MSDITGFIDTLKTLLEADAAFIALGGSVRTGPISTKDEEPERIVAIHGATNDVDVVALGDQAVSAAQQGTWDVTGQIFGSAVIGTEPDGDENATKEARDAAAAMRNALDDVLRSNNAGIGAGTKTQRLLTETWTQGSGDSGTLRTCRIDFTIRVRVR